MSSDFRQMTVKKLAEIGDVTVDAIRYYTKLGLLRPGRNSTNDYRLYDNQDLIRVRFIRRAKTLGFSISEIRTILSDSGKGISPCPRVRAIIEKNIHRQKRVLEEALILQKRMEEALKTWQELPDGIPVGDSICHLIESIT